MNQEKERSNSNIVHLYVKGVHFSYNINAIKRILHLFSWLCFTVFFVFFNTSDNFHKTNVSLTTPPLDRLHK